MKDGDWPDIEVGAGDWSDMEGGAGNWSDVDKEGLGSSLIWK